MSLVGTCLTLAESDSTDGQGCEAQRNAGNDDGGGWIDSDDAIVDGTGSGTWRDGPVRDAGDCETGAHAVVAESSGADGEDCGAGGSA